MPHPPIVIPEIGQGEEIKVQKTVDSIKRVAREIKVLKPKTIVIITPHGPLFKDALAISDTDSINGDFARFGNSNVTLKKKINQKLTKNIIQSILDENISVVPVGNKSKSRYGIELELDHGALVPLYYIDREYSDYNLVHITYGILEKSELYKIGMIIKEQIEKLGKETVVIASGDLSHRLKDSGPYEYNENGQIFDKLILSLLKQGATESIFNMDKNLVEEAGECGLRSIYILLGTLDSCKFSGELFSYEGTFGVGYGVMKISEIESRNSLMKNIKNIDNEKKKNSKKSNSPYVNLARKSLEYYLKNNAHMDVPSDLPKEMLNKERGIFVTFNMDGELRGCIGTILPTTECIAKEIIRNSVEAGTRDPRFYPINLEELPFLEVSVDELMKPESATFDQLDPKNYGVIVRTRFKSGLLLPDLEGVNTKEDQVDIALRKAGISPNEDYKIERFKVIRHR